MEACQLPHRRLRTQAPWAYFIVFGAALLLYAATMAPDVLWQDSGMTQVRVLRRDLHGDIGLALAHPLYYLLAFAFQWLPFAESALKTNLVSAVFGAVTVANVFVLVGGLTGCRRAGLIGATSLAVAHTFWQHCALAEVYTVSTALLTAELLCVWQFDRTGRERWLVVLFLLNGLGVSNHMLASLSAACYGVLAVWLVARGRVRSRMLPVMALAWLVGAGLYLALIGGSIHAGTGVGATIRSALFGKYFAANVLNVAPSGRQLANSGLVLGMNFPTPTALLALPGLAALRSSGSRRVGTVLMALLGIHLVWAVRYDVPDQYTFFIPTVVLIAVLIGLGADRFLRRYPRAWAIVLAAALLPAAVYVALPQVARAASLRLGTERQVPYRDEYAYFLHPWKTGYDGARRFAEEAHAALPDEAVLLADTTTAPPIHYLQLTGHWTKAVRVLVPASRAEVSEEALQDEVMEGRVYVVSPEPRYCFAWPWLPERCDFEKVGVVYRAKLREE